MTTTISFTCAMWRSLSYLRAPAWIDDRCRTGRRPIGMRGQTFDSARLVDDALEEARDRVVVERPLVHGAYVRQHLGLATGLIHRLVKLLLQLADRERM